MQTVNDVYIMQIMQIWGPSLCTASLAAQLFFGIYWLKRLFLRIVGCLSLPEQPPLALFLSKLLLS
jgi:hypothetical protein